MTSGIEVLARREALGLSQIKFAEWIGWKHTRVSEAEAGKRGWPARFDAKLAELEDAAADLAETLYSAGLAQAEAGGEALVPTYRTDEAMRADWPDLDMPVIVHRVAAADAVKSLIDEGFQARIIDAGLSPA